MRTEHWIPVVFNMYDSRCTNGMLPYWWSLDKKRYDMVVLIPIKRTNISSFFLKISCTLVVWVCLALSYMEQMLGEGWLRHTGIGENSDFLEMKSWNKIFWVNREDATIVCMHTHANLYLEVWLTARKKRDFIFIPYKNSPLPVPHGSIRENRCFFVLCDVVSYTHVIPTSL